MKNNTKKQHTVCVIVGAEGYCLAINNTRMLGPKPWGGGTVLVEWKVTEERRKEIIEELKQPEP